MDDPQGTTYRGFLFSDLRDYTAFVERHGDAAAAALLERYRVLVRSAIARFQGAEVKTEGDSFFVVFPSAGSAVRCALEIVEAAGAASRDDPATPLRIGIGVHAGETVAGSEGYVGSAVNLAARICAQARPGEVLVSDIVRGLTRTSLEVTFVDRGRRRLKGIPEPVQLYVVSSAAEGAAPRRAPANWARHRYLVPLLAALVLGIGGVSALVLSTIPGREPVTATGSAGSAVPDTPRPLQHGALSTGRYRTVRFQPPFSFFVGPGWSLGKDSPDDFYLQHPEGTLGAFRPTVVYLGPCLDSPTRRIQGGSEELLTWLEEHEQLESVNPLPRNVSGVTAIQIDVAADQQAESCPRDGLLHLLPLGNPGDSGIRLAPGERVRFVVLDLPDGTVTFDVTAPPDRYERFLTDADAVLDTVSFADPG